MNCDSFIKAKIEKNCAEPIARGVERTAWIGNRAQLDIANLEFVEGSTNQVLNLPLIKGAQLYPIVQYGTKPFEGLKTDLDGSGKLGGTASTEFPFIVPDNSPAVCENIIDPLLDGEFFVIWQNRHKTCGPRMRRNAGRRPTKSPDFSMALRCRPGRARNTATTPYRAGLLRSKRRKRPVRRCSSTRVRLQPPRRSSKRCSPPPMRSNTL